MSSLKRGDIHLIKKIGYGYYGVLNCIKCKKYKKLLLKN
jgi:hypothetical protein